MKALRAKIQFDTESLEFGEKIVTQRIADGIVVPQRSGDIAADFWVKARHQRRRSAKTPSRNSSMEIVETSPDWVSLTLCATSSSETS